MPHAINIVGTAVNRPPEGAAAHAQPATDQTHDPHGLMTNVCVNRRRLRRATDIAGPSSAQTLVSAPTRFG
eukprot:CAMPEP_0119386464 /NCGR_PEP_ID=MMETSP1334-20130426/96128_1 /TAXON_ID=127549 /ORGANISM="Calcidiscus leptoporus, Strain RCC1130" /LENGTH=70 /DNA_ID=CAMNT_0007407973 /DNA_START=57 /DNA_END=265 /DNA_ORIENTATION=-